MDELAISKDQIVVSWVEHQAYKVGKWPVMTNEVGPLKDTLVVLLVAAANVDDMGVRFVHLLLKLVDSKRLVGIVEDLIKLERLLFVFADDVEEVLRRRRHAPQDFFGKLFFVVEFESVVAFELLLKSTEIAFADAFAAGGACSVSWINFSVTRQLLDFL